VEPEPLKAAMGGWHLMQNILMMTIKIIVNSLAMLVEILHTRTV